MRPKYVLVKNPGEQSFLKLEEMGFPASLREIWQEEDVPDVYVVGGTTVVDLQFLDDRVLIAAKKDVVVVLYRKKPRLVRWVRNALRKKRKFTEDAGEFLYRAVRMEFEYISEYISDVHKDITRIERTLYRNLRTEDEGTILHVYDVILRLLDLRRELAYFLKVVMKLRKSPIVKAEHAEEIKELTHEVLSFVDLVIGTARSLLDLHDRALSMELNLLIKRLTSISIILAVITIITGIYGMNFRYLPLAEHPYGFWILNGLMLALFFLMLWAFKKIRWL